MSIPAAKIESRHSGAAARVALETAVLTHGLPRDAAQRMAEALPAAVEQAGAVGAFVGVIDGCAVVGMGEAQLAALFDAPEPVKINASNLGLALSQDWTGGVTVSAALEIAAAAGLRVVATGGIGGVHGAGGQRLDISADLLALARFPLAVVCSGVKSILDVAATREALESLGVPVIGWRTDALPAFHLRDSGERVHARFDDLAQLAAFVRLELARADRAIIVANPIPGDSAVDPSAWPRWLREAEKRVRKREAGQTRGRAATPALLEALADVSAGATVAANEALLIDNARLAGALARTLTESDD